MIELNMNAQTSEWKIESELMECTFYSQVLLFRRLIRKIAIAWFSTNDIVSSGIHDIYCLLCIVYPMLICFINWVDDINWPPYRVFKLTSRALALRLPFVIPSSSLGQPLVSPWSALRHPFVITSSSLRHPFVSPSLAPLPQFSSLSFPFYCGF